jgi:hypothetical protein
MKETSTVLHRRTAQYDRIVSLGTLSESTEARKTCLVLVLVATKALGHVEAQGSQR